MAAEQSCEENITTVPPLRKVVAVMQGDAFPSTWVASKAIYRTRKAMADGGELIILAPGLQRFGEQADVDQIIGRYGYCVIIPVPELFRPILTERLFPVEGCASRACTCGVAGIDVRWRRFSIRELAEARKGSDLEDLEDLEDILRRPSTIHRLRSCLLGGYLDPFCAWLSDQGFSDRTIRNKVWSVARFSCWMAQKRLPVDSLNERCVDGFVDSKRRRGLRTWRDMRPALLSRTRS